MQVLIRHCAGMRGLCEGRLIAFDRHMNLVLCNVTEWCTPFRTVANGGITLSKNQRRRRKKMKVVAEEQERNGNRERLGDEVCSVELGVVEDEGGGARRVEDGGGGAGRRWEKRQSVRQLFVRGDNVILVSSAP